MPASPLPETICLGMEAPLIALILLAFWRLPEWGRKWLAFRRDLDRYREQRGLRPSRPQ